MKLTRREMLKYSTAALALGSAGAWPAFAGGKPRPNIVLIIADDLCANALGVAGNPLIHTPNIDRLAREGWYFKNNFVTTSICPVSRESILTAQYARRHGVHGFQKNLSREAFLQTYPARLREAGYFTGHVGKWGIADGAPYPEWLFDVFDEPTRTVPHYRQAVESAEGKTIQHLTDIQGGEAERFIETAPKDKPFFLSLCTFAPHFPFIPQERFKAKYTGVEFPRHATDTQAAWNAIAPLFEKTLNARDYKRSMQTDAQFQTFMRNYAALVSGVDEMVGNVMVALRQRGALENTVVIITSDNGYMQGQHQLGGKWCMFEDSIRTPLVMWAGKEVLPAAKRAQVRGVSLNIDLAPTVLDIAGVVAPGVMQGESLVPLMRGAAISRADFYYEHARGAGILQCEGVREARWKYSRYTTQKGEAVEMLFDLEQDVHELKNLAADKAAAGELERLRARVAEYQK